MSDLAVLVAPNGTGAFQDPKSFTDVSGGPAVLLDDIADKTGTETYSQQIKLPDVACDNCTLQVIQVMTDKPPYGDGNDLYYQCADIILTKDGAAAPDAGAPAAPPPPASTSDCTVTTGSQERDTTGVLAATLAIATLTWRRRRCTRAHRALRPTRPRSIPSLVLHGFRGQKRWRWIE